MQKFMENVWLQRKDFSPENVEIDCLEARTFILGRHATDVCIMHIPSSRGVAVDQERKGKVSYNRGWKCNLRMFLIAERVFLAKYLQAQWRRSPQEAHLMSALGLVVTVGPSPSILLCQGLPLKEGGNSGAHAQQNAKFWGEGLIILRS